jgi:hypothetical protein
MGNVSSHNTFLVLVGTSMYFYIKWGKMPAIMPCKGQKCKTTVVEGKLHYVLLHLWMIFIPLGFGLYRVFLENRWIDLKELPGEASKAKKIRRIETSTLLCSLNLLSMFMMSTAVRGVEEQVRHIDVSGYYAFFIFSLYIILILVLFTHYAWRVKISHEI